MVGGGLRGTPGVGAEVSEQEGALEITVITAVTGTIY